MRACHAAAQRDWSLSTDWSIFTTYRAPIGRLDVDIDWLVGDSNVLVTEPQWLKCHL
ncbi:hypothetical protein BJ970_001042 [Saccharopolyspora phatthalungensis]|uniref:Uncharacterized protein n=1 Tax=Saccharopolyspora phatthalungensis TaxID=664693 RepID=A0A840Q444_9PSEU|nr:hypothetical protein [Saccharopolyspora phatthalungensis]